MTGASHEAMPANENSLQNQSGTPVVGTTLVGSIRSRMSTYQIKEYADKAKAYAPLTLEAIESATPNQPTVQPVPYKGVQFLAIPEFQDLGTRVSQQISAAIADQKSVDAAVAQSQKYAAVVGATYRENK